MVVRRSIITSRIEPMLRAIRTDTVEKYHDEQDRLKFLKNKKKLVR